MNQQVILDKLKEAIGDDKVMAAVFYTFNFDPVFFEQHILPSFLPDVPFTSNEIQNNILWRQYAGELPPVTVYCDFHAKDASRGPSLPYEVRAIDMKTTKDGKACFHPKVSFILLENSMVLITGSNNLTPGGWSYNKEVFTVMRLDGSEYPYELKTDLWDFLYSTSELFSETEDYSEAEKSVESFIKKRNHPRSEKIHFYQNHQRDFLSLLGELKEKNGDQPFDRMEIISPYISDSPEFVEKLIERKYAENIFLALPYQGVGEVAITEECYNLYEKNGINWAGFVEPDADTFRRFNHSKIYRLKGKQVNFTIFGSVNLTHSAWKSVAKGGNLETALVIKEAYGKFKNWLIPNREKKLTFQAGQKDETSRNIRHDVPEITFTINWEEKQLDYHLKEKQFTGKVQISYEKNKKLLPGKNHFQLDDESLQFLGNNPLLKVMARGEEYYYYPNQTGIESKPFPSKYQLTDREIIELWDKISDKKDGFSELVQLKERFILSRLDREGNWDEDQKTLSKSTMNLMAAHLSALIKLEEKLFTMPGYKRDYEKKRKQLNYYLFAENLDTLPSYLNLLDKMNEKEELNEGVHWFILNILSLNFFNKKKLKDFVKKIRGDHADIRKTEKRAEVMIKIIHKKQGELEKKMTKNGVNKKLFKWIAGEVKIER